MEDRIEKRIELKAPVSRVWRALTDYQEFGKWFRVALEEPFAPGKTVRGRCLYPGFEHIVWEAEIQQMQPERLFSFAWPIAKSLDKADYNPDYSGEPQTLVEFRLEKTANGTLLVLTESGFSKLPDDRREKAFRGNEGGWTEQMKNIETYVTQNP
jgi:uncharacterized protein YndB with AHSA1/START domain